MIFTKLALISFACAGFSAAQSMPVENAPECAAFDPAEHVYVASDDCTTFFQCFGGTNWGSNPCPDGLLFNEEIDVCDWPADTVCRDDLDWSTTTSNIASIDGDGWTISEGGLCARIDINDSQNCGGPNSSTQSATASVTFNTAYDYDLSANLTGLVELEDVGFETLSVFVDGVMVMSAASAGGSLGCIPGPPNVVDVVMQPYPLSAGLHTINIDFTTVDSLYHVDSFYKLCLDFATPTSGCCAGEANAHKAVNDCKGFVQCSGGLLMGDYQPCPPGLLFDESIQNCNLEDDVTCGVDECVGQYTPPIIS